MRNDAPVQKQIQEVIVYIKEDCHLCDTMLEQLEQIRKEGNPATSFRVLIRDIEDRPDWYQSYREYVPVIVINDKEICHYFFDQQEFNNALLCQ